MRTPSPAATRRATWPRTPAGRSWPGRRRGSAPGCSAARHPPPRPPPVARHLPHGRDRPARHDDVIADALAGQAHRRHRLHRLPGHGPRRAAAAGGARLRARAARPAGPARAPSSSGPSGRSSATTASTALRAELGGSRRSTSWSTAGCTVIAGDVGTDGLGLDEAARGDPRQLRHRHPLGRDGQLRLAHRPAPSRSTCSAPPASPRRSTTSACAPHLVAVSTCYVAGNRRGSAPEIRVDESPFWIRRRLAAARSTSARRVRADAEAESRAPERPRSGSWPRPARELGRRRRPRSSPRRPSSAASRLGQGPAGRRRPGPRRLPRLARRLRHDQGARREGAGREPGRRPRVDRPPRHHRVGAGPSRCRAGSAASAWPSR